MPRYLPTPPAPRWATLDLFPSGFGAFEDTPTKVEPSAGLLASGVGPEQQIAAQHYNWKHNKLGEIAAVIPHIGINQWWASVPGDLHDGTHGRGAECYQTGLAAADGLDDVMRGRMFCSWNPPTTLAVGAGTGVISKPCVAVFGDVATDGNWLWVSSNGIRWSRTGGGLNLDHVLGCNGDSGKLFVVNGNEHVYSASNLNTWTDDTVAGAGDRFWCVAYTALMGGVIFVGGGRSGMSENDLIWYIDNSSVWTQATTPNTGGKITQIEINKDASVMVAVGQGTKVIRSIDGGFNWIAAAAGAFDVSLSYLAYSPTHDQFMIVQPSGKVWISQDGDEWSLAKDFGMTLPIPNGHDPEFLNAKLAACGPCFALLIDDEIAATSDFRRMGVLYTYDLGETWNLSDFGQLVPTSFDVLWTIREWAGRFIVGADGVIYISNPLWVPDSDFAP